MPKLSPFAISGCCALAASLLACATAPPDVGPPAAGRLPVDVQPLHYTLELEIDPRAERFRGRARIRVHLSRARSQVWLHARDLEVRALRVTAKGEPHPAHWGPQGEGDLVAVQLAAPLGPGDAEIEIEYEAAFVSSLRGLYRVEHAGEHYAFTQFEAIDARTAFPSFDEPVFKTPFDVELRVRAGDEAIANTPVIEERAEGEGWKRLRYATTEPLPTYLVAWAVGPLDVVEAPAIAANEVRKEPLPFRGVAPRGRGDQLAWALANTAPILEWMERYLGVAYPYAKLDVIAVPDFAAGAMENAGAITFRDWLLLFEGDSAPEYQRRAFVHVMAHELAHQWFGNLVTMPWWDDIWLNESFATWFTTRCIEDLYPEHQAELGAVESAHAVMQNDALVNARRIREPVLSDHDIGNAFDGITYQKGSAVLRMFESWLGREPFQRGLRLYLDRHRFGTATAADLMAALGEIAALDVGAPFSSFLDQAGVPLVEAELRCEDERPRLHLAQTRYLPLGSPASDSARARRWQVPVCASFPSAPDAAVHTQCVLLSDPAVVVALDAEECPAWFLPNSRAAGYYHFALPGAQLDALRKKGWPLLSDAERLAVADGVSSGVWSGALDAESAYAALPSLAVDPVRAVASAPFGLLRFARDRLFVALPLRSAVEGYAHSLYAERAATFSWDDDPAQPLDGEGRLLRAELFGFLADVARDPALRAEAAQRGRRYLGVPEEDGALDVDAAAPGLLRLAAAVAVEEGGRVEFEAALRHLRESDDAEVRGRLLSALAGARAPSLAERARALALDSDLRENEVLVALRVQMGRPEQRPAAWAWLQANYDALVERLSKRRASALARLAGRFCSEGHALEVERFFQGRIDAIVGGPRTLRQTLESTRVCAAQVDGQRASAERFFEGLEGAGS